MVKRKIIPMQGNIKRIKLILLKRGFTLVEILIVTSIIFIFCAILIPKAFRLIEKTKRAKCLGDLRTIESAAAAYYSDTGVHPRDNIGTDVDFMNNPAAPNNRIGWDGPYLDIWPTPPWELARGANQPIRYEWEEDLIESPAGGNNDVPDFDDDNTNDNAHLGCCSSVVINFRSNTTTTIDNVGRLLDRQCGDDGDLNTGNFQRGTATAGRLDSLYYRASYKEPIG